MHCEGNNRLGQVRSGKKYWADGTPVAGQQFEYAFDDIGNRTATKAGGDENGANLRQATYYPNIRNQYTSRGVPRAIDVIGVSFATNTVAVNGQTAYRKGEYFRKELTLASSSAVWTNIQVQAGGQSTNGNVFVPANPESFQYDLDGNLANDGRWSYGWDAENQLTNIVANTTAGPQLRILFEYDWQGRRIGKRVWNNTAASGAPILNEKYVYDGWNLIAVLNSDLSPVTSFAWGSDLSGSMQGAGLSAIASATAGGVGGLVSVTVHTGANAGTYFCCYDGNGNVLALVNATSGAVAARYEYGPFGELIRATGPMAKANPFRFSTKYQDDETDLLYYGLRYLKTSTGGWLSRDPIGEYGGKNLYGFVGNNPISFVDKLGRFRFPFCNGCDKLNQVKVITEEWEIGTPDKTAEQIENLKDALHEVKKLEEAASILELIEGKPSIAFPKADLEDPSVVNNLLMFQPVNLFGRIKYKVCSNVGPRFFGFGSDQLDWIEHTEGWDPSDMNTYGSGLEALADVPRFMQQMLEGIKSRYPTAP